MKLQKKFPIEEATSYSPSHSFRSRCSHSDASLRASSSAGFGTSLPTFAVERKTKIACVHRSSAKRSRIVNQSLPLPVSRHTYAHRDFCWRFQCGQHLMMSSRVCVQ